MQQERGIDEKGRIRAELLKKRDSLPPAERRQLSERIANALRGLDEFRKARRIMYYVAVRAEVETEELIRGCLARGKKVSVPCCDPASGRISAADIRDFDRDLAAGCYGIPEPIGARRETVAAADIDLFIVPGVGFDWTGVRLGWGKGYYDSFLAAADARAVKIGLAYEAQLLPLIQPRSRDVAMDKIVTEERVIDCRKMRSYIKQAK
ncbi:MAG: 5-formyltetrahydrofolate cyclo-ligase [Candidatus Aureabacteria bacterium]|jgi:5-formyltetrahydrofolate cyclo-ligase|nr:5-formyltetrahydrofolate cyclo-ligase [Candidatus Auribacterota bacterium]